jgi:hypothetical protein
MSSLSALFGCTQSPELYYIDWTAFCPLNSHNKVIKEPPKVSQNVFLCHTLRPYFYLHPVPQYTLTLAYQITSLHQYTQAALLDNQQQ